MKVNTYATLAALTLSVGLMETAIPIATAADSMDGSAAATAADNTDVNKRDRAAAEPTADQARNSSSDLDLMRKIRQEIIQDKSLSTYAHNVKVIAKGGKVTLKGTVHTDAEKASIGEKASNVAGAENVTNNLLVKGS